LVTAESSDVRASRRPRRGINYRAVRRDLAIVGVVVLAIAAGALVLSMVSDTEGERAGTASSAGLAPTATIADETPVAPAAAETPEFAARLPKAGAGSARKQRGDADPVAELYVATTGSDVNPGTAGAPFRTLQHAADVVEAGQVVRVRAGKYVGMNFYRPRGAGTAGKPIRFLADPGVVINSSAKVGPNADSGINLEPGKGGIVISGFHILNEDRSMERACIRVASNNDVQILQNTCEKPGTWGIIVGLCEDVVIEGNVCAESAGEHGIYVGRASKRVIVRRNIIRDNARDGFHLNGGADGPIEAALVEGNVIFGNQLSGIDADGVRNSLFRNNLVYGNVKHAATFYNNDTRTPCENNVLVNNTLVSPRMFAVQLKPGSTGQRLYNNILISTVRSNYGSIGVTGAPTGLLSDYNVVVDRFSTDLAGSHVSRAAWAAATGQDAHSIVATPGQLFADPSKGDFRLRAGAAAIDAGVKGVASLRLPPDDILGNRRPRGKGIDIGAYEQEP
jgi:hypothetical protein